MSNQKINEMLTEDSKMVKLILEMELLSLNKRIGDNVINLYNYQKHDGNIGSNVTGKAILINKIPNLTVIDIDINKSLDDNDKQTVRTKILNKLNEDDIVVQTASGGLHIYANTDNFYANSNRMIKCYTCDEFDIDIMTSMDETKRSLIVLPNSKVRKDHRSKTNVYQLIRGSFDSPLTRNVNDILNDLDIKLYIKSSEEIDNIIKFDNVNVNISDELANVLVNGLEYLDIHNDGGNMPINKEITLFTLFQAINSLPNEYIELAYDRVLNSSKLTENAQINFDKAKQRYSCMRTSPFVLVKMYKIWKNDYYTNEILPLLRNDNDIVKPIDMSDSFSMTDIRRKAETKQYKNTNDIISDLSRVIRFIESGSMYIQKDYNIFDKRWGITFVTDTNMTRNLKMIKLWKTENKTTTAYDILLSGLSKLTLQGVMFNANDTPNVFSIFQGFKYNILEHVDMNIISMFLNFVREVIADSNDDVYEYIINWIANIVQHPGVKNETALILKGIQGIGKNRFTDVISELFAGYSSRNVTEIGELTGNFNSVVESKMLIVLNELKNCGDDRLANFNALKSVITENIIRINEKNQPRRESENVANFIFVTNHSFPVKIEAGDRRYVVLSCNGKYKNNFEYFSELCSSFTYEFYDNLLTYLMNKDLSSFNVRSIPMTDAKQDIIEASKSPMEIWICNHYSKLCEGIKCTEALVCKPAEMKDKNFQLQLKDKCDHKQKTKNGIRSWYYILKDDCKHMYKQTVVDIDDDFVENL